MSKFEAAMRAVRKAMDAEEPLPDYYEWVFVFKDGVIVVTKQDDDLQVNTFLGAPTVMDMELGADELIEHEEATG